MNMFSPLTPEENASSQGASARSNNRRPILPVPDDAPEVKFRHPEFGIPTKRWPYHNAEGQLLFYIARFDYQNAEGAPSKEYLPLTFCDLGNGRRQWRAKGIEGQRPLYRMHEILARPDAPVIVTEGEKAADAATVLFPEMIATTPPNGAQSPHRADWTPLAGRQVIIATDNDEPGARFGDKVALLLREAGAAEILHLAPHPLADWIWRNGERLPRGADIPKGWDLADALEEGWTAEAVKEARVSQPHFFSPYPHDEEDTAEASSGWRWPFRLTERGVEKRIEKVDKETGQTTVEWRWFCSSLEVVADTRNDDGEDWGRLLRVTDRDARNKEWAMPMSMLAGDGSAYRERLLSLGLILAPGRFAREALHEMISTARPTEKARCVSHLGWSSQAFVLPRQTITLGNDGERVLYQSDAYATDPYRVGGTLDGWQSSVAALAAGNSRLVFAISAALAGPLLKLVETESGGFHFRGGSSIGKTTALQVAGSLWGGRDFIRSWRATSNGLESIAAMHCDTVLLLDEMGQCDSREVGQSAYMLANGQGKTRAGRNGEARRALRWRTLFLSTGEISLADKMAEDGRGGRAAAGQEVRVTDIPADAGAGLGIFEDLHGFPSADEFARHLEAAVSEHFGHASLAFLNALVRGRDEVPGEVKNIQQQFIEAHCPPFADGQVRRVLARFGLVAAAGELATQFGIVRWQPLEAARAAAKCFSDWLEARGGAEPAEEREALAAVRRFIELHGSSRFEPMGELAPKDSFGNPVETRIVDRAGFRRRDKAGGTEYIVLPEVWRSEICKGFDPSLVARTLLKHGILKAGEQGKPQRNVRLPMSSKTYRCYVIASHILGDCQGEEEHD